MIPSDEIRVWGLDMSVNWDGDLEMSKDWFVERVWLWIGTLSWDWIRVLSWEIVMLGLSICNRSNPSLLLILINMLKIELGELMSLIEDLMIELKVFI